MAEKKLKYGIKEQIEKIHPDLRGAKRKEIMARLKITYVTLSEYENIDEDEARMIPADYFPVLADLLNCRMVDLLPKKLQTF